LTPFKPGYLPAITWLLISTILLTIPGSSFPKENWLEKLWVDKWVHLAMFSIMVFLWCWATMKIPQSTTQRKKTFIIIACFALVYGSAMEFVQHYLIPNRSFDAGDIIADAAGCGAGFIFSWTRYIKK
jgi:hypothetical protein